MPENVGASVAAIAIGQTTFAYSFFLPKLSDVRRASDDDDSIRGDVVLGQLAAAAVSISVGAMLSWLTGSAVPTYTTVFIAIVIGFIYQFALSGGRVFE